MREHEERRHEVWQQRIKEEAEHMDRLEREGRLVETKVKNLRELRSSGSMWVFCGRLPKDLFESNEFMREFSNSMEPLPLLDPSPPPVVPSDELDTPYEG